MRTIKIAAVGGGTGLYYSLRALKILQKKVNKEIRLRISAIVSTADDGGSTGKLRDEFGYLPPGDIRRALLALSHDSGTLRKLFEYRFTKGSGLEGHNIGNLLLTALTDIYGDGYEAIRRAGRILHVNGRVIPVTTDDTRLCAELEDGTVIKGETNIDIPKHNPDLMIRKVYLEPAATIFGPAEEALRDADIIIIGPGDLYTSIIPNLLVEGFNNAINDNEVVLVTNIMTKYGETNNFKVSDFLRVIREYTDKITHLVCNNKKPSEETLKEYAREHSEYVLPDSGENPELVVIAKELIANNKLVRHDPELLAKTYHEIIHKKYKR